MLVLSIYLSVAHREDQVEEMPLYPTFKKVGEWFGGFDQVASMYSVCFLSICPFPSSVDEPRWFMLTVYCALQDGVCILEARFAIHWW